MVKNKQVTDLQDQLAQMETNWKRALADYQNLQKRTQQQQAVVARLACLSVIEKILPILDHLLLAANHLHDTGLDMVVKQMQDMLLSEGVQKIDALNQPFDPLKMEAADQGEGEKDVVIEVLAEGYMIDNQVIRPVKVKVGKGAK